MAAPAPTDIPAIRVPVSPTMLDIAKAIRPDDSNRKLRDAFDGGGVKVDMLALVVQLLCCTLTGASFVFEADSFLAETGNRPRVGQALFVGGLGLLFAVPWVLVALVPALLIVRHGVIAREERYLERRFGEEYRRFCSQVRRWL